MEIIKLGLYLTLGIIGVFIVFGFVIGWLNKISIKNVYRAFGKPALYLTAFIGTPIHEFGHYIMCKIFLHEVTEVRWFIPSAIEKGGTLGYVNHRRSNNIYQRVGDFFIGIGPLIVGSILIVALCRLLMADTFSQIINMSSFKVTEVLNVIFSVENLKTWNFWLFIILAISISSHMTLSKPDIENSYFGAIILLCINMAIAAAIVTLNMDTTKIFKFLYTYNLVCITLMSIGVVTIILTIMVSIALRSIRGR